jgi:uncharacterized delta-60 repeat protein
MQEMRKILCILLVAFVISVTTAVLANPGDLDATFGLGGIVTTLIEGYAVGRALVLQRDGKLVAAGEASSGSNYDFALARYTEDGSLDTSFGNGGTVTTPIGTGQGVSAGALVQQADGKLVAAGNAYTGSKEDFALVRYTPDGSLDPSFGNGGIVMSSLGASDDIAAALVQQIDGRLVALGYSSGDFALTRYTEDGSLDASFGNGGKVVTPIGTRAIGRALVQQHDGKLVAAGYSFNGSNYDFALTRYTEDGNLDASFGNGGTVTTPIGTGYALAHALVQQADGKLVAGGGAANCCNYDFALVRYTADGSLDASFGNGGKVVTPIGSDSLVRTLVQQTDGKLVAAGAAYTGSNYDFALVRYTEDGNLDATFGNGGKLTMPIGPSDDGAYALVQQVDKKLVALGYFYTGSGNSYEFAVARYLNNICGNGVQEPGEACDDGLANGTMASCCTISCTTPNPAEPDSDGDGIGDACDPCTNDGTRYATKAKITATKLGPPSGNDGLKISGVITVPATPPINPIANGLRVLYGDQGNAYGSIFDKLVLPGAYNPATKTGWIAHNGSFKYVNDDGTNDLYNVQLKANARVPGQYKVVVKGNHGTYAGNPARLPEKAAVVIDRPFATTGQCGEWSFPATPLETPSCVINPAGTSVKCR